MSETNTKHNPVYMPRKVLALGQSLAITIPTRIVREFGIQKGDEFSFVLNPDGTYSFSIKGRTSHVKAEDVHS